MKINIQKTAPLKYILGVLFLFSLVWISGCTSLVPSPTPIPPTPTVTQTYTPTPTIDWFPATPTPTLIAASSPTPQPTLEAQREGITALLIDDDFIDERLWTTPQGPAGNVAFGTENLSLAVARANTSLSSVSQHEHPANFYLEITIQTSLCQPQDETGLVFGRQSNNDFYRLLINCAGEFRFELVQGGQRIVLRDWEDATRMELGLAATNRLGLWVYQGEFQLYINDVFQFSEGIARDRSGGLGVFASTVSGSAMTVKFSDLQIYQVEMD